MTEQELGKALTEARTARGLTLHDVERDTRINRRYLQALEEGELEVMPAPVYARAFMRTYAQYLGLNARQLVQNLPGARPEPELPPLPQVAREPATPLLSPGWLVSGAVVIVLLLGGLFLFWTRGDNGAEQATTEDPPVAGEAPEGPGLGSEQPTPPVAGMPTPPVIEPGIAPNFQGQPTIVAINMLSGAGVPYVIIDVDTEDVPPGYVLEQTPAPGSELGEDTVITLRVRPAP